MNKKNLSLVIIGKRWSDKVNGNTYHSVRIYNNGEEIAYIPFVYGGNEQYLTTASEKLQELELIPAGTWIDIKRYSRENRIPCVIDVSDGRKKDL